MSGMPFLDPDRLFPADTHVRSLARSLYESVKDLPIISPHGHTDPSWFAQDTAFSDPTSLFLTPDHYVLRMLRSAGIPYDRLGVNRKDDKPVAGGREAWRLFCSNWHLFEGTPSRLWIEHSLEMFFGVSIPLSAATADEIYDTIDAGLKSPALRPLAVLDRAGVEAIATTEFALDPLDHHRVLKEKGLIGRVRTTYRPDDVTDPELPNFAENLARFGELTSEDTSSWTGMIRAHAVRRAFFRQYGATASDHGVPSALTADLADHEKQALLDKALSGSISAAEAEQFRAQMLTEMAGLSVEDGMVMQLHAGVLRSTDPALLADYGANLGADVPCRADYVNGLRPLLVRYGNAEKFRLILFTLDETTYARELAPLAGYWPSVMVGPPWWFHDSPNGIRRYLDAMHETAGFFNMAGFNDDTRALLSIPARHDVWRREVCRFMAILVSEHRISHTQSVELASHLCYGAAKRAYNLS